MTKLFEEISILLPKLHGWCTVEKAQQLAATVIALRPLVTVEIGVWGGKSFIPMAMAHREIGRGNAWAIDPWSPAASAIDMAGPDAEWWGKVADHDLVYADFLNRLNEVHAANCVVIRRMKSDDAEIPHTIDLLHIDGNHGDQALKDAQRYAVKVRVGGMCCLDDLDWSGGAVRRAEAFLKSIGFIELYRIGTGAMYQRVGSV